MRHDRPLRSFSASHIRFISLRIISVKVKLPHYCCCDRAIVPNSLKHYRTDDPLAKSAPCALTRHVSHVSAYDGEFRSSPPSPPIPMKIVARESSRGIYAYIDVRADRNSRLYDSPCNCHKQPVADAFHVSGMPSRRSARDK